MITLLASLVGFISSIFPDVLKLFFDRSDKRHEIDVLKYQMRMNEKGTSSHLDEIALLNNISESKSLYKTYKTGVPWVDALNGTVRPIVAFSFFFLYSATKYLKYKVIVESGSLIEHLGELWTIDDQAIFAGIISFYYGQRALRKFRSKR